MPFTKLIESLKKIEKEIPHIVDKTILENTHILVDYVVEDQMFEQGIGGTGQSFPDYTPVTIKIKKIKGQPTNRVTGRDTGDMHDSTHVELRNHTFTIKHGGESYMKEFENEYGHQRPFDITEENLTDFRENYVLPDLIDGFIKRL